MLSGGKEKGVLLVAVKPVLQLRTIRRHLQCIYTQWMIFSLKSDWGKGICCFGVISDRGFGEVWSARNRNTYIMYAIKKVDVIDDSQSLENEIAMLQSCNFPFIVSYYSAEKNGREVWVGFESLLH